MLCRKIFKSTNPTQSQQEKLSQQEDNFVAKASLAWAANESKLIYSFASNHNSKIYDYINSLSKNSPLSLSNLNLPRMTTRKQHCLIHSFTLCSLKAPSHSLLLIHSALNMGDIHVTEEEVYEALSALDPTKSSGIDGIGSKLLKHCALAIYALICHLFNLTITKRYFPSEWKLHLITPYTQVRWQSTG